MQLFLIWSRTVPAASPFLLVLDLANFLASGRGHPKGSLVGGFVHWGWASSQRKMALEGFELKIEFPRLNENPDRIYADGMMGDA